MKYHHLRTALLKIIFSEFSIVWRIKIVKNTLSLFDLAHSDQMFNYSLSDNVKPLAREVEFCLQTLI